MLATQGTTQVRRRPPSDAPRPKIAHDIVRVAAACRHVASVRWLPPGIGVADCINAASGALSNERVRDNETTVADALNRLAVGRARTVLNESIVRACEATGVTVTEHDPFWLAELASAAGLAAGPIPTTTDVRNAAKGRRDRPARTVARVASAAAALSRLDTGAVSTEARAAYRSATPPTGDVEAVTAKLINDGIDAEKLCWAVIHRESLRHEGLVWQRANRLAANLASTTAEQLFGLGWQGLRVALRRYDPEAAAFSTYAAHRIDGTIRDGVRADSPIPKRLGTFQRKAAAAEERLVLALGRAPTLSEMAAELGVEQTQLHILPRLVPTASIDEMSDPTRDAPTPRVLTDMGLGPDQAAERGLLVDAVRTALQALPPEEADAVRVLDLEGVPMAEAESLLDATNRQLRQRRRKGHEKLADILADWQL